jgi:polyisoprenoid-binding protein YceI
MRFSSCMAALALALSASAVEVYDLDPGATRVGFDIDRFGLHWLSANFHSLRGDFIFDRRGPASRVDVTVQTDSVDCGSSYWNPRLRSPEWLNVQQYPLMSFHSRHIEFEAEDRAEASGELTLHGVTHPIVLSVTQLECPSPAAAAPVCHFNAQAHVKRSDFGLPHGFWTGGDQVDITITGIGMRTDRVSATFLK